MAPGWEMAMDFQDSMSPSPATNMYGLAPTGQALRVDGLLDFSHHNLFSSSTSSVNVAGTQLLVHPTQDHTTPAANYVDLHHPRPFPDDLYIPSDEVAELEWLSQFVEDSFSYTPYPSSSNTTTHHQSQLTPPWSTQPPPPQPRSTSSSTTSSSSSSDITSPKAATSMNKRKVQSGEAAGDVRRCTHCSSEKTPQWRTGPLGPKTLCNACGVRFKSGRLVPEYRPAASPTFVLSHHSNSHRKVVELRRQKELLLQHRHGHDPSAAGSADRPELLFHDYEVC